MNSNSYSEWLFNRLEMFRRDGFCCDTVIVAGQHQLKAHGIVLAAASSVFKEALGSNSEPGLRYFTLCGYDFDVIETAVKFIYTGTLEVGAIYRSPDMITKLLGSLADLGLNMEQLQGCTMHFKSEEKHATPENLTDGWNQIKSEVQCIKEDPFETASQSNDEVASSTETHNKHLLTNSSPEELLKKDVENEVYLSSVASTSEVQANRPTSYNSSVVNTTVSELVLHNETGVHFLEIPSVLLTKVETETHECLELKSKSQNLNNPTKDYCRSGKSVKRQKGILHRRMKTIISENQLVACQEKTDAEETSESIALQQELLMHSDVPDAAIKKKYVRMNRQKLVCPTCGKVFGKVDHLTLHLRVHTGEKPYACNICDKKFSFVNNLQRHMRSHTGDKRYLCHLCGRGFIQKTTLVDHIAVHTKEKKHLCNLCGKFFKSPGCLRAHRKRHGYQQTAESLVTNDNVARFVCKLCRKHYASKNSLALHMQYHSNRAKPFVCTICEKSFWQRAHMEIHERVHTGERPFSCSTCGKSFTYAGGLNTHIRLHTGEKPYKCDICGSSYTQKAHLTSHKRTHSGEKPFECKGCGKKYRNKVDLRLHLKRSHACNDKI